MARIGSSAAFGEVLWQESLRVWCRIARRDTKPQVTFLRTYRGPKRICVSAGTSRPAGISAPHSKRFLPCESSKHRTRGLSCQASLARVALEPIVAGLSQPALPARRAQNAGTSRPTPRTPGALLPAGHTHPVGHPRRALLPAGRTRPVGRSRPARPAHSCPQDIPVPWGIPGPRAPRSPRARKGGRPHVAVGPLGRVPCPEPQRASASQHKGAEEPATSRRPACGRRTSRPGQRR